jgi:hypothetical protein
VSPGGRSGFLGRQVATSHRGHDGSHRGSGISSRCHRRQLETHRPVAARRDETIETKLQCHTVTGQPFGWIKTFGVADANWSNDFSSSPLPHIIPFASRRFWQQRDESRVAR